MAMPQDEATARLREYPAWKLQGDALVRGRLRVASVRDPAHAAALAVLAAEARDAVAVDGLPAAVGDRRRTAGVVTTITTGIACGAGRRRALSGHVRACLRLAELASADRVARLAAGTGTRGIRILAAFYAAVHRRAAVAVHVRRRAAVFEHLAGDRSLRRLRGRIDEHASVIGGARDDRRDGGEGRRACDGDLART